MHQALFIQDILLHIFNHFHPTIAWGPEKCLPALARTCRTFKEPALDLLWEELSGLAPLAQCFPDACCESNIRTYYSFSRPLDECEWHTLQSYTRRVKRIRPFMPLYGNLDSSAIRVIFTLAPFTEPLFPNLRSLHWLDFTTLPTKHAIVPSLTSVHFDFTCRPRGQPLPTEFLDVVGERCRYMRDFYARVQDPTGSFNTAISLQVLRWANLESLSCLNISLSKDAVLHLVSTVTLTRLSFTLSEDLPTHVSRFGSILVFLNLSYLHIASASLTSVTRLFSHVRFPAIMDLRVTPSGGAWKGDVHAYWAAIEQACSSNTLRLITLDYYQDRTILPRTPNEYADLQLTLDDLSFYKTFHDLLGIYIDLPWSVKLTDDDLLSLVHTSPNLSRLAINPDWGWRLDDNGGGLTLDGFVRLLREHPFLRFVELAFDTRSFMDIPQGLDAVSRSEMSIHFSDSYISDELVQGLASVLIALKVSPYGFRFKYSPFERYGESDSPWGNLRRVMRHHLQSAARDV